MHRFERAPVAMESQGEREDYIHRDDTHYRYHSDEVHVDAGHPEYNARFRISSLLSEKSPEAPYNYQKEASMRYRQHPNIPRTYGHPYSYPPRTHSTQDVDRNRHNVTAAADNYYYAKRPNSPEGYEHRDSVCSVESAATAISASSTSTRASLKHEPTVNPSYAYVSSPETPTEHFVGAEESLTDSNSNTNGPETKGRSELKRLKNREAAARCRYRRKKQLGDLQEQVDMLVAEKTAMEKQKNDKIQELQTQVERLLNEKEDQQRRIDMLTNILTSIKNGPGY